MKKLFFFLFLLSGHFLLAQPVNDNCASALQIVTDSACVNGTSRLTAQTLTNATNQSYTISSSCSHLATARDVWYRFVARTKNPVITISNQGTGWGGIANVRIQLLSGTCGTFTEVACGSGPSLSPSLSNPLIEGNTYFIRIHSNSTAVIGANYTFDICVTDPYETGGRMKEVFQQTILSPANALNYPWEITYGPDNNLWVTESRGYKLYRIDPATGVKTTVLDLSTGSTWLTSNGAPAGSDSLAAINTASWNGGWPSGSASNPNWPQGGFAGMALHPQFLDGSGTNDYVYVSYVHRYLGGGGTTNGVLFRNKLVRFTYNTSTQKFSSPVVLCDTLPGSNDHNSQRLIIAPVGGTYYLFMASGDMGAGQFGNRYRTQKAQNPASYEGKILRFNLVSDNPVTGETGAAEWIPNDNPYSSTSAVWSIGIRNNQGFAYDAVNNILYGSSHGPYSDDEINIIEAFKNYGHPLVIGYAADGNYNGNSSSGTNTSVSAGTGYNDATAPNPLLPAFTAPYNGKSTCPPIGSETVNVSTINAGTNGQYKDPIFSAYAPDNATMTSSWQNPGANSNWRSEGWSGIDLYSNTVIPGWKRSIIAGGLKWGRLIRLKLNASGTATLPSNTTGSAANEGDTVTYFQSVNRYRDIAFSRNGKDIFIITDNNAATSGPGVGNPIVPACPGCVIKYTFLGYAEAGGKSTIPTSIDVTTGSLNTCNPGTSVTIDASNNFLWVPITGPDGNIMAEINANGQNLGLITSSFYQSSGSLRNKNGTRYLDRNITITPQNQPASPVKVRLYLTKTEFSALDADPLGGVTTISDLKILKNNDPCSNAAIASTTLINPTYAEAHGANGFMLQANISGFSSFYFASSNITLPLELLTFTGSLQPNGSTLLNWKTTNEINTSVFIIEKSTDGSSYAAIGNVTAAGNSTTEINYAYTDNQSGNLQYLTAYYRLKIVDQDGSFKYSNIVMITLADITGKVLVAPNPVTNQLNIAITSPMDGKVQYKIIDNSGRVVLQKGLIVRKGPGNNISVNISNYGRGVYYLNVTGAGINSNVKIQKL
ncbi:MAG TPA: PQQ-dependent sugar dehydrogenase [Chitinophagaceae bacterium]|nr:PQQ-dependent sugar dehydrogenase [Chitinophagaceae bacterium]